MILLLPLSLSTMIREQNVSTNLDQISCQWLAITFLKLFDWLKKNFVNYLRELTNTNKNKELVNG